MTPTEAPPEEETSEVEAEARICCEDGTFTCASNPAIVIDYATPRCGAALKPAAQTLCRNQCGGVACIDSGWSPPYCE